MTTSRVTSLEELASWLTEAKSRGAARFELWRKVRGAEQERAHSSTDEEVLDLADALLTIVERDRRVDVGQAVYVACAFRGQDKAPIERVFVTPIGRAVATPIGSSSSLLEPESSGSPQALASVLMTTQQMIRDVFGMLQRENEQQRRTNESLMRATTGHFEAFAKGYERTLDELHKRHVETMADNASLRAQSEAREVDHKALLAQLAELSESREVEIVKEQRESRREALMEEQFKILLPIAIAMLPRQSFDSSSVFGQALEAFLDSLKEPQIRAILGGLDPAQSAFVGTLIRDRQKKKAAAEEAKAKGDAAAPPAPAPPTTSRAGASPPAPPARTPMRVPVGENAANAPAPTEDEMTRAMEIITDHSDVFSAWMERKSAASTDEERASASAEAAGRADTAPRNENGTPPAT